MTDQDLLTQLQYALVEPLNLGAAWTAELWSVDEVTSFLNSRQDGLLRDTGIIVTRPGALPTVPNTARHLLPQDWMLTRRVVWHIPTVADVEEGQASFLITLGIGTPGDIPHFILVGLGPHPSVTAGRYYPLIKARWEEVDAGSVHAEHALTSRPLVYLEPEEITPTLQIEVSPAAYDTGVLEPWLITTGIPLSNTGVSLTMPDECAPLLKYGVLADMLAAGTRAQDPERAQYAESRYQEGLAVIQGMFLAGWR